MPAILHKKDPNTEGVHVALLRGINVGGKNVLPMKVLVALFEGAGCRAVRTYIQSGNVIFEANAALAALIPSIISARIEAECGFSPPVLVRSASDLAAVVRDNPHRGAGAEPSTLHVAFLAVAPSPALIATLDARRSPPDTFIVRGRELYLCLPNGVARTKLTNAYFDARLRTTCTVRNWRTVQALVALCG